MEVAIAPLIAGTFAVIVALLQKSRKENKRDHGTVLDHLELISSEIRKDIRQVRYEVRDNRTELREHIRREHYGPDSIPTTDSEAERP